MCFVSSGSSSRCRICRCSGRDLCRAVALCAARSAFCVGPTARVGPCTSRTHSRMNAAASRAPFCSVTCARSAARPAARRTPSGTARSHLTALRSSSRSRRRTTARVVSARAGGRLTARYPAAAIQQLHSDDRMSTSLCVCVVSAQNQVRSVGDFFFVVFR